MAEVSHLTREDMNLMLVNQQKIMAALNLPTPMLTKDVTFVVAVSRRSTQPSSFQHHDNMPKGKRMVIGTSDRWDQ